MNDKTEYKTASGTQNGALDDTRTERQRREDAFWDLDSMLPRSVQERAFDPAGSRQTVMQEAPAAAPRDTEAVEIVTGSTHEDTEEILIPPIPNITSRTQRAAAYRSSKNTYGRDPMHTMRTPGDVSPQMAQPVCSYTPENSLLRQVSVFRWPERYQYYERFTADAQRYYNRTAAECPFVNFFAYMPQYASMSQDQLRWYLYWRDNVRHGVYLATDYSYIFLYVYEIINLPDKIAPRNGLDMLCDLWLAYREQLPRLDRYLGEWVCDYCLIYELPAPLERLADILPALISTLTFREFYVAFDSTGECPITAQLCDVLTGAAWRQSKYLTPENRPLFEEHLYGAVLGALRYAWETDADFVSLLGFSEVQQSRNAFSGALCTYACKRRIDVSYLSLSRSYQLKFIISDLFKLAENCIRAHLGIKARLNATGVPEPLKTYVKHYFEEKLPPLRAVRKQAETKASKAAAERAEAESAYAALYEPLSETLSPEAALALEMDSWVNTEMLVAEETDGADHSADSAAEAVGAPDERVDTESESRVSADSDDRRTGNFDDAVNADARLSEDSTDADADEDITYDDPYENFVRHLNDLYYTALKHIICCEEREFRALCASAALLPDAVADAINELAVVYTEDTVLDADGTFWVLSDFYANDVMNAVVAREEDQ